MKTYRISFVSKPNAIKAMKRILLAFFPVIVLVYFSSCTHIEMDISVPSGGILEDVILVTSSGGEAPREAKKLGDIDLSEDNLTFHYALDTTNLTHWWLIGHRDGDVVYTSNLGLRQVDLFAVEPYDAASPISWYIPSNLDAFVNGNRYSLDWWAQTVTNHSSHVAEDKNSATLWQFGTTGSEIGTITVRLAEPLD